MYEEFVDDGYIIVQQDIRGLHHSEGTFVMNRPIVGPLNNTGIDESTDAYDTIDWLVKNVPEIERQGRDDRLVLSRLPDAGVGDQSAPGAEGGGSAEPDGRRLDGRRLVPQRRVPRRRLRLRAWRRAPARPMPARRSRVGAGDDYTRYLEAGSMADYARKCDIENIPFVQKLFQNPAYTEFWSRQAVDKWMAAHPLTVPTMLEVGAVGPGGQLRRAGGLPRAQGQI